MKTVKDMINKPVNEIAGSIQLDLNSKKLNSLTPYII